MILKRIVFYGVLLLFVLASWFRIADAAVFVWPEGSCQMDGVKYQPPNIVVSACGTVYAVPAKPGVTYSNAMVLAVLVVPAVDRIYSGGFQ